MDKDTLLRYLTQVKDLEWTLYTLNCLSAKLKSRAATLGVPHQLSVLQQKPFHYTYAFDSERLGTRLFWGAALWSILLVLTCWDPLNWNVLQGVNSDTKFLILLLSPLIAVAFFVITTYMCMRREKRDYLQRQEKEKQAFAEQKAKFLARAKRELPIKQKLNQQIQMIDKKRTETQNTLNKLYDLNIIYPKYRSLIPIISFCEYFESGICDQLTGHEGAYNKYEQDVKLNYILTKLDIIISHLEDIKRNQDMLYQAISETNRIVSRVESSNQRMLSSMNVIEQNSALVEYNTRAAAINTRALGEYVIFRDMLTNH